MGASYLEALHPKDISVAEEALQEARDGRLPGMFQFRCLKKDGSYLWMEASLRLYSESSAGDAPGFVVVMRDISLRKAAEEEPAKGLPHGGGAGQHRWFDRHREPPAL